MQIRTANMEDVKQLRHLYAELEADAVRYQPEHFTMGVRSDDFFRFIFENEEQEILVADVDGRVIGFSHVMLLQQSLQGNRSEEMIFVFKYKKSTKKEKEV